MRILLVRALLTGRQEVLPGCAGERQLELSAELNGGLCELQQMLSLRMEVGGKKLRGIELTVGEGVSAGFGGVW